jgi:hypothetical protein
MSWKDTKLCIPELAVKAGQLLDINFLGIPLRVPPLDIVLTPELCIDFKPIIDVIMKILDAMAAEFYERRKGE